MTGSVPVGRASPAQPKERMPAMINAAAKALAQMFSPPFRWVLLKSAGLALAVIVLLAIALHRLLVWISSVGANWAEEMFGISAPAPISILIWVFSIAAGLGVIVGSVFLMPAVTVPASNAELRSRHHGLARMRARGRVRARSAPSSCGRNLVRDTRSSLSHILGPNTP